MTSASRRRRSTRLVRNFSGGNQQKVVIAKWLFRGSKVLLCDEPTRGIDVGAKAEIYDLLWTLAAEGKGVLFISSDLPELIVISHRIIVFAKGRVVGEVAQSRVRPASHPVAWPTRNTDLSEATETRTGPQGRAAALERRPALLDARGGRRGRLSS